jgi:hypothetical protein
MAEEFERQAALPQKLHKRLPGKDRCASRADASFEAVKKQDTLSGI